MFFHYTEKCGVSTELTTYKQDHFRQKNPIEAQQRCLVTHFTTQKINYELQLFYERVNLTLNIAELPYLHIIRSPFTNERMKFVCKRR